MRRLTVALAILFALTMASGCGFELRGQAALDPALARSALDVSPPNPALRRELVRLLEANGIEVAAASADGVTQIRVANALVEREIQSVGAGARVREFALIHRATLSAESATGESLLAPRELRIRRDYTFDESQALGIGAEEEVITEELGRDMARRILAELEAAGR